ncbi:head GIN domain-containing protein [Pedobacter duraquae]|uniref:Putative autotransporter adhesin-like protein n=1 Tax=Pedobacter duraquae TaxID=425511 RepID=A0A4R6IK24_9SPHI|nr:head GIN domain-containing protein [Pedobacter duraquae]TDO22400.1 putative autotransporter adhesin-like protein [Pedobacter duraquae]
MKKIVPLLFSGILALSTISCLAKPASTTTIKQTEDRTVKNFSGIAAGGPIDVIVTIGNTESVRFEGDADAIATLVTEVRGNVLIIRPQNSWKSWAKKYEDKKITAYVSAKKISSLTMSGSGSMRVNSPINQSELTTTLSGSGSIKVGLDVQELTSVLSGSGTISLTGSADKTTVTLSGSGVLNGKSLKVGSLSTTLSGSGSVNVDASDEINAVISGSGTVNYRQSPTIHKTVIGSGGVRRGL